MTISAKVNTHGSYSREFSIIFFNTSEVLKAGKIYTFVATLIPNNDITVPEILVGGNPTYYYQKYDTNTHKYILIARADTSVNGSFSVKSSGVSIGDTISFTMSDLACYEGAYVNPPEQVPLSLDVQPTNQFVLAETSFDSYQKITGSSSPHWYRIHIHTGNDYIHSYLAIQEHRTLIEIESGFKITPNLPTLKAKVLLNDNSSSCIIQKFRHRSYNSTVYLEAYINSSTDFTVSLYMLPRYRTDVSNLASINYTKLPLLMVNGDGDINTSPSFDCSPDFSYFS